MRPGNALLFLESPMFLADLLTGHEPAGRSADGLVRGRVPDPLAGLRPGNALLFLGRVLDAAQGTHGRRETIQAFQDSTLRFQNNYGGEIARRLAACGRVTPALLATIRSAPC